MSETLRARRKETGETCGQGTGISGGQWAAIIAASNADAPISLDKTEIAFGQIPSEELLEKATQWVRSANRKLGLGLSDRKIEDAAAETVAQLIERRDRILNPWRYPDVQEKLDANGYPVLDADGNPVMVPRVRKKGLDLLGRADSNEEDLGPRVAYRQAIFSKFAATGTLGGREFRAYKLKCERIREFEQEHHTFPTKRQIQTIHDEVYAELKREDPKLSYNFDMLREQFREGSLGDGDLVSPAKPSPESMDQAIDRLLMMADQGYQSPAATVIESVVPVEQRKRADFAAQPGRSPGEASYQRRNSLNMVNEIAMGRRINQLEGRLGSKRADAVMTEIAGYGDFDEVQRAVREGRASKDVRKVVPMVFQRTGEFSRRSAGDRRRLVVDAVAAKGTFSAVVIAARDGRLETDATLALLSVFSDDSDRLEALTSLESAGSRGMETWLAAMTAAEVRPV